jgi:hypothetical protein
MCNWELIQCAAAMRVIRVANTSSDSKATAAGHQMQSVPPADSRFPSRSYVNFVTDQELQQAKADLEECFRRRARRAGLEKSLPADRPMTEEEIEDLQWQLGDFGPVSGYRSRGTKRGKDVINMTIKEMEAEIQETNEAIRKRQRRNPGLMLKPLWMLTACSCMPAEEPGGGLHRLRLFQSEQHGGIVLPAGAGCMRQHGEGWRGGDNCIG